MLKLFEFFCLKVSKSWDFQNFISEFLKNLLKS
jgi:hypothetical protein